jgi:hypothetical protein
MGQNDADDDVGIYIEEIQRTSFTFNINRVVQNQFLTEPFMLEEYIAHSQIISLQRSLTCCHLNFFPWLLKWEEKSQSCSSFYVYLGSKWCQQILFPV